jgi:uncharacterized membrane protein HdeD (DUF308 family)
VLDIVAAIRMRKVIEDEWLMILNGAVAIVFGIAVFLFPATGALAVVWLISFYAMLTGVLMLMLAFKLRAKLRTMQRQERRTTPDRRISPAH